MSKSEMRRSFALTLRAITFDVRRSGDDFEDQVTFIKLLEMAFDGVIDGSFERHTIDKKNFIELSVKFPSYEKWLDAKAHCFSHLDENGVVHKTYVGALERADPGRRHTRFLIREIDRQCY